MKDSYLDWLWSKAIKKKYDGRCAKCFNAMGQSHHVVRRAKKVLRWDLENGIYLCTKHHKWAHTLTGRRWVESKIDLDYLTERDVTLADWCTDQGITKQEFKNQMGKKLKDFLEDK